jgi:ribosome biogenesis GTPase
MTAAVSAARPTPALAAPCFDTLHRIGLTPALHQALLDTPHEPIGPGPSAPARVVEVHRETVVLLDGVAPCTARAHPRLEVDLRCAATALAVGDWVLHAPDANGDRWVVARAAPVTQLTRRDGDGLRHVLVSNVDVAFIVVGLDGDYNPRRVERFLTLVQAGAGDAVAIRPVVVLTKRDWYDAIAGAGSADLRADALRTRLGAAVPVLAVNGLEPETAAPLAACVGPAETAVLVGSSGAGKSTLTNTLLGRHAEDTGAVRAADSRGKHTTTHRALYELPGGGCVIDTPGIRTLRPDVDAEALGATFADIATLAGRCRFRDCRHAGEPGCAVRDGVDADRLANWHKLGRELRRDTMTVLDRQRQLSQWKERSRAGRERMRMKRGDG